MKVAEVVRVDERLASRPIFFGEGKDFVLVGSVCVDCGAVAFPARQVCLVCGGDQVRAELTGEGTVHSWTHLANPPAGFEKGLYYGCIDLDEGPRVLAGIEGGLPRIGARVKAVPATVKDGAMGFSFRLNDA